jgi:hypothetical protein
MKTFLSLILGLLALSASCSANEIAPEVLQQRMQKYLPYAADQTIETFTKTVHGGIQHVVVKSANNVAQIKLIQAYLQKMVEQFRKGDFSVTERLHGADMPGLAQLKTAEPYDIKYEYKALENGGQIHYSTEDPLFHAALDRWFNAQISDHGEATIPGHSQHHSSIAE